MTSQSPRKFFLVEEDDPALSYEGGIVIALNPLPLYQLETRGIAFKILEDFYDEKELRKTDAFYYADQLRWLADFDRFLKDRISLCREYSFDLARASYNRIKYFVDVLITHAFILRSLVSEIERVGGELVYVRKRQAQVSKNLEAYRRSERSHFFWDLAPRICQEKSVLFSMHEFGSALETSANPSSPSQAGAGPFRVLAKSFYNTWRFKKFSNMFRHAGVATPRVLFLHAGSLFLDPIIRDFHKTGAVVFTRAGKKIFHSSTFRESEVLDLDSADLGGEGETIQKECQAAAAEFETVGRLLLDWIDVEAGLIVRDIASPYLKVFIAEACSQMLREAVALASFYRRYQIDYALTHTHSDLTCKSAVLASKMVPGVRTVCIQHCCEVFDDKLMPITDLGPFDFYFTTDNISEAVYRRYAEESKISSCHIYQSPHYLRTIRQKSFKKRKAASRPEKILYIPTKMGAVHIRPRNCMGFSILWYLEFQKKLLGFLAGRSEFQFIYKKPPIEARFVDEAVIPYMKRHSFQNISIRSDSIASCLRDADRVLIDRPTTAFFEAIVTGLPTLCIYPEFLSALISPECRDFFGNTLQPFSSEEDAFRKIDAFLKAPALEYAIPLPMREDGVVRILEKQLMQNKEAFSEVGVHEFQKV